MLPEHRLNRAHDPGLATDLDPLANFERPLNTQMARRHHLVATPQLIAIANPSHREQDDTWNGPDIPRASEGVDCGLLKRD